MFIFHLLGVFDTLACGVYREYRKIFNVTVHKCTCMMRMWNTIKKHLEEYPERLRVARVLVENGLSAKDDKIYLNQIEIPPVRIARVAGVDRRTVNETLNIIKANRA